MANERYPEIRALELIVELAEQRSFTAAAEALHLSQSALSRAVSDTERRVGAALFTRTTRSVEPTVVGSEFIRLARKQLADAARSAHEFALYRDGQRGIVRVSAVPSVAATLLPAFLAELRSSRPGITVEVDDTLSLEATDRLMSGLVDFAITADDSIPDGAHFAPLVADRFHVVFRHDHRFHGRSSVTWREFAEEPSVRFGSSSSLRAFTDRTLTHLGLSVTPAAEAQNIAVVAGLVSTGLGVAAVPALVLPLMQFADLEAVELVAPTIDRTLGLVSVPGRTLTPAALYFAETLTARTTMGQTRA